MPMPSNCNPNHVAHPTRAAAPSLRSSNARRSARRDLKAGSDDDRSNNDMPPTVGARPGAPPASATHLWTTRAGWRGCGKRGQEAAPVPLAPEPEEPELLDPPEPELEPPEPEV